MPSNNIHETIFDWVVANKLNRKHINTHIVSNVCINVKYQAVEWVYQLRT